MTPQRAASDFEAQFDTWRVHTTYGDPTPNDKLDPTPETRRLATTPESGPNHAHDALPAASNGR